MIHRPIRYCPWPISMASITEWEGAGGWRIGAKSIIPDGTHINPHFHHWLVRFISVLCFNLLIVSSNDSPSISRQTHQNLTMGRDITSPSDALRSLLVEDEDDGNDEDDKMKNNNNRISAMRVLCSD